MQIQNDRFCWRTSFIGGLQLLAQAAARLPFGVQDPILGGSSAVELYTGGLWVSPNLEVLTPHPQALTTELFVVGFRWCERPGQTSAGLWHPGLAIGLEVIDHRPVLEAAGQANRLAIAIDQWPLRSADTGATSLMVVGIEDLIAEQVGHWLAAGARSGEFAVRLQTLVGLGREGVGGPLREGYLERRVAWQSGGEVVLDLPTSDDGMASDHTVRAMNLTRMRVLISTWRSRNGLTSGDALPSRRQNDAGSRLNQFNPQLNRVPRRAGRPNKTSAQIVPFDVAPSPLPP
jgi:hypothetical protein